jgi:hypothetical protein
MTELIEDLKSAAELLERARELVGKAAKVAFLPSEAERGAVRDEIVRIRLKLMLLRSDINKLHATANRGKPRVAANKVRLG